MERINLNRNVTKQQLKEVEQLEKLAQLDQ